MTQSENAALERLIAATLKHPLALVFSSAQREKAVADVRRIARDGLTRREAVRVVEIVSNKSDRAKIESVLNTLGSSEDTLIVLRWLVNDASRALSATEPDVQLPTTPTSDFTLPWLCLPITCGFYADRDNLDATLVSVAKLAAKHGVVGQLGVDIEITGDLIRIAKSVEELFALIWERCTFVSDHVIPRCAQLAIPAKINGGNSNDFGKGFANVWKDTPKNRAAFVDLHKRFAERLVMWSPMILAQAIAETDSSMSADFRRACQKAWTDAGFPKSRMAAENSEGGAAFNEIHIKIPGGVTAGKRDYVSTDNDKGIPAHFDGGGPLAAYIPRVDACLKSAVQYAKSGTPFSLYHRVLTLEIISQLDKYDQIVGGVRNHLRLASGSTSTSPDTGTTGGSADDVIPVSEITIIGNNKKDPKKAAVTRKLHSASISGNKISFKTDPLNWPTQTGNNGKTTDGGLVLIWRDGDGYIGGWFDHHGVNQTVKGLENITGGYIDKRQPQKGAKCYIYLISYDGKQRTNIVEAGKW